MPHRDTDEDEDDEAWNSYREEDGEPLDEEFDDEDSPEIVCPHCGEEFYEESVCCPHCGEYLSQEDAPQEIKPLWIAIGTILCLIVIWWWIRHP